MTIHESVGSKLRVQRPKTIKVDGYAQRHLSFRVERDMSNERQHDHELVEIAVIISLGWTKHSIPNDWRYRDPLDKGCTTCTGRTPLA